MEAWPDVPTLPELGFKLDTRGFVGLGAPARTPKPIVAYLNKHLNEVLQTDVFKKPMAGLGMAPLNHFSDEEVVTEISQATLAARRPQK